VAVFVNGCYWHRCPHCRPPLPKSHPEFWSAKFAANQERDARKTAELEAAGWVVVTVWECRVHEDVSFVLDALRRVDDKPS
jgi:DNA mismatch endonuclease (patch repair protein)